jgi:excisionase family DNA binding protein
VGEGFEPYVTKEAVAARIGVNQRTIRRLMNKGVLGHYKIGTQVRFKWSEVESDLREHCHVGVNPSRPAADGKPNPETRYPSTASPLTREIRKPETRYPRRAE